MMAQMTASRSMVMDYVALTKPRIISLLLVTALGGMFLGAGGVPEWTLVLIVLVGGTLGAGGANALNHFMDRDIDELMIRTRNRPVARGAISPRNALIFGVALNVAAFALLSAGANLLCAPSDPERDSLLRVHLYQGTEAFDPSEHRYRWRRRGDSAHGGLGSRYGVSGPSRPVPFCHHLLLDASPLLGLVAAAQGRLRAGRSAHVAGRRRRGAD